MAVCEMWDVTGRLDHPIDYAVNAEKTAKKDFAQGDLQALRDVMNYTTNNVKTSAEDKEHYVSGINCYIDTAREQMQQTKLEWEDDKKIVCYHGFQSFKPNELTPDLAHQIGIELAEKLWGDKFQVVVATHLNTDCLHNHFVINATSFNDGSRFKDNKKSLANMRRVSDEICKEHNLSVIENPDGEKSHYCIRQAEKNGEETKYVRIRNAIDYAISISRTREIFVKEMTKLGYSVRYGDKRKYITIYPLDGSKSVRSYRLGDDYTKERIFERIAEYRIHHNDVPFHPARRYPERRNMGLLTILFGLQSKTLMSEYRLYSILLGAIPKGVKTNSVAMSYHLRAESRKQDMISRETVFLHKHKIKTLEQLLNMKDNLETQKAELFTKRKKLWNSLRTINDPDKITEVKLEIENCTKQISELYKQIKYCDNIEKRSPKVKQTLEIIGNETKEQLQEQQQDKSKTKKHTGKEK